MKIKLFKPRNRTPLGHVRFEPAGIDVPIFSAESVLQVAKKARVPVEFSCDGNATCGTCRVFIEKGLESLPPPNELEQEWITERGFATNERLACQTPAAEGLVVRVPKGRLIP